MNCTIESVTSPSNPVCECTELVRGNEQLLLERLLPLVRRQSIALNLQNVTRIDAAGMATLIKLYCAARETRHSFAISHLSPQVKEILALVGLDGVLQSRNTDRFSYCSMRLEEIAA